ncbi:DUF917 domain-containing protein [Streptomyces tsukubensis]|uniref:DUF917 domain-containing protein n=1 Tax=Streptomyces tsukubensis TaxID=83656 RepID=A0A1V4AA93_9ACTN|nr:DUF917 domain-containing protein [Streptomyces tsukubensis]OON80030.1 hypothetical protein B1H18_12660 [Streptomyces tsukubensis]QFR97263.1 DUF917 family protein [Streptomyces tsukubensis]
MSWTLGPSELDDLARGAAILGTGGGGDPWIGRLLVAEAMREHGPVTVLDPEEVADDALVVPVANMGAPTVMIEKLPGADEPVAALRALERFLGREADATMPIECGGGNSMIPLIVAARTGLPVVDADGMGRAFPELQMETFHVYGLTASPLAMAGDHGETCVFDTGRDTVRLEDLARRVTVGLGGGAAIAEFAMSGSDLKRTAVPRTLSLALALGRAVREARAEHRDPVAALGEAVKGTIYGHLRVLFRGKVTDVERRTEGGFAQGRAAFTSMDGTSGLEVRFQNEHLAALVDGEVVCLVPDLVCVLEVDTGEPITTEALRYGQRVAVVGIAAPAIMRTPEALAVFGPQAFGLPFPFRPVERILPV